MRSYTVLEPDPVTGTFAIDFVLHGTGFAVRGRRPRRRATGSARGPGSATRPNPTRTGTSSSATTPRIPAIRQALAALPDDAWATP